MEAKIKMNPFFPVATFGKVFDDLFSRNIDDVVGVDFAHRTPAVNIRETETSFELDFAVPGLQKKDFNISIENDQLIVSADREITENEEGKNYRRREFAYTKFVRTFRLPETVNKEDIKATYQNGVLRVIVAKIPEVELKRTVEVK